MDRTVKPLYDSGDPKDVERIVQHVFGEMVKLATPVLKGYHSDLYHDAVWLARHLRGQSFVFMWRLDESGTLINKGSKRYHYRITAAVDKDGRYTIRIEGDDPPNQDRHRYITADGTQIADGARLFSFFDGTWVKIRIRGTLADPEHPSHDDWDGWFYTTREDGGSGPLLNAERLAGSKPEWVKEDHHA